MDDVNTMRRFTEQEDLDLARRYMVDRQPISKIARELGRSEGVLRLRIYRLGLRRSAAITKLLQWAPEQLKARLQDMDDSAWIAACYAWRDEQRQREAYAKAEEAEQAKAERMARGTQIDQDGDLTRNQKIEAKRLAGLTVEEIAAQHDLSPERVRRITDASFSPPLQPLLPPEEKQALLNERYERYTRASERQIETVLKRLLGAWRSAPPEVRERFRTLIAEDEP